MTPTAVRAGGPYATPASLHHATATATAAVAVPPVPEHVMHHLLDRQPPGTT
ncbi:hypothetical protein ABZX95_45820 [Streptomyces sp. NPDC004232]|uniref:hypothetical protein n=1 Tax=unclassified Streptomyces TaxID=2593676 RepID=UPI0033A8090A